MKKAAIYVKHKYNSWASPKIKIDNCKEFAESKQLEVVDVYYDWVKNNKQKKYALEQLFKDCKKHKFDYVIILSVENVSRKCWEFRRYYEKLQSYGVKFITVNGSVIAFEYLNKLGWLI